MSVRQRIALYGGTFDPVHSGHLEVARRVSQFFEIELLLFIPAHIAPHKLDLKVTAPFHRYAMLALATQNDPELLVSTYELSAPDRRYTVDTLQYFQEQFGPATEIFFIMGADSWEEITTWRDWERLLTMANHIVVTRPGYDIEAARVGSELSSRITDLRGKRYARGSTTEPGIFLTDLVMNDVSATQIRRAVAEGPAERLRELVPQPVADYIMKYRLYLDSNETEFFS
jgi:nicotinate-nucleotide adenylyltransferase